HVVAVLHPGAGIEDDLVAFAKPFEDLRFAATTSPHFDHLQSCKSLFNPERRPILALTKQRAGWDFQSLICFPNDYPRFNAKIISNTRTLRGGCKQVSDYIDPLFFHAKSRNFGKRSRLHESNSSQQRRLPAPLFEFDLCSGCNHRPITR